jgi:hypothetical protein
MPIDKNRVLEKQDFDFFYCSVLSQEVPLPAYNPTSFVVSRKDPLVIYAATLGTFHCYGNNSHLPGDVVEEERKKRGFDSQLVVYKLRLTDKKDFLVQKKTTHRFIMATTEDYIGECADGTTLKESADGSSLIFLSNHRSLLFDPLTLELKHNFNQRILDIFGRTVLLQNGYQNYFLSELSQIDDDPKPLDMKTKISNENLEDSIQGERFVAHEGKWFSFFVARYKGNQMKVFRFQVEH